MPDSSSTALLTWFFLGMGAVIALAAAAWLLIPNRLAARRLQRVPSIPLDVEDSYRTALSQVVGFPLAVIGTAGAAMAVFQAVKTYQDSTRLAYQEQYRHGFDALASKSVATRIGGLYVLQGLSSLKRTDNADSISPGKDQGGLLVLRALAAFAVDHPAPSGMLVPTDSLAALQIVAWRSTANDTRFDVRNGRFHGAWLAIDDARSYADLRHFDLFNVDLSGSDLYCAQMYESNLRATHFEGANLVNADMSHAKLTDAEFSPGMNESVPSMNEGRPVPTDMKYATFYSSLARNVKFSGAQLQCAIFDNATLDSADFSNADLTQTSFLNAKLSKPSFQGAWLVNTDLRGSELVAEALVGAHLCNAILPSGVVTTRDCPAEEERLRKLSFPNCEARENRRSRVCPSRSDK